MSQTVSQATEALTWVRGLSAVTSRFDHATVKMLQARALLRRTDTKFLVPAEMVVWILAGLSNDYLMLPSGNRYFARYDTTYFDTPDLRCFHDHRRGCRPRHKIRVRHYPDRGVSYLEVKSKDTSTETRKHRVRRTFGDDSLGGDGRRFVAMCCDLPVDELEPSMRMQFFRLTLLGKYTEERLTVDLGLDFDGAPPGRDLSGVGIVEVKQRHLQRRTPIMRALRAHQFRQGSASKYCTALALSRPSVRRNQIRPVLRAIERIQRHA